MPVNSSVSGDFEGFLLAFKIRRNEQEMNKKSAIDYTN
jgi:hypothetical protein